MTDKEGKTIVELRAWLGPEELEAVTRWAGEANCPDIREYLQKYLAEVIARQIRWEEHEKKLKEGGVNFDDELPF